MMLGKVCLASLDNLIFEEHPTQHSDGGDEIARNVIYIRCPWLMWHAKIFVYHELKEGRF